MSVCSIVVVGAKGRMGSTILSMAERDPDLTVAGVTERSEAFEALNSLPYLKSTELSRLLPNTPGSVVIDFTNPETSVRNACSAAETGNPIVIGTTGLKPEQLAELEKCAQKAPVFWSPNMSVGINVILKILPDLVRGLGLNYDIEITEIHHNKKADSPSGTALKLAQKLAEARGWDYDRVKKHGRDGIIGPRGKDELGVLAVRGGDVVGDHTIHFFGPGERVELTHRAHSRENFAQGALMVAKWLVGQKPGKLYAMADVF